MLVRVYGLDVRSKAGVLALGLAALAMGGVLLAFGLALLLGLGAIGAVLGAGAAVYHKLTGRHLFGLRVVRSSAGLDPSKEVFPPEGSVPGQLGASRPGEQPTLGKLSRPPSHE